MTAIIIKDWKKEILTVPNVLSLFRLLLIPVYVVLYLKAKTNTYYNIAAAILAVSCLTDLVDGKIARRFNLITTVGKVLDPIADKTTQLAIMILLCFRFPLMIVPIIFTAIKESFMAISGYVVVKKCGIVLGANWHGKAATTVVASVMLLHLFWYDINPTVSAVLILASAAMILLSLILYAVRNFGYILGKRKD
jgi:cardiolipin synthase